MKTSLPFCFLLAACLACSSGAAAQTALPASGGYWNIETNIKTRDYTIVRFYNAQDQLVYEERLDRLCLNLSSSRPLCHRTMSQLNLALQQLLQDPGLGTRNPTMLADQLNANRRVQRVYAVR